MKRMDDETAAHLMTALETDTDDERDIARDWRRARERERRLEEALREFEGAFTDLDPDNQATRNRMRRALIQARAALSPSPASADDCEHDTEPTEGERDALRAQVEQMRGAAEAVWDALNLENRGHPQAILAMRAARERSQTAAFSPSPASGVAGDRCEAGNECGRTGCPECQQ